MNITIDNEKSIYSQGGEDGIIEYIFSNIQTTNKVAVEIGVSASPPGKCENNTYNLGINGWKTFWFDIKDTNMFPNNCVFTKSHLTVNNVIQHFKQVNIPKEFDLLSIDIDSNDYHIREKLSLYNPRVVIMEYNGCFDYKTEYVMPYNENYIWQGFHMRDFGASLLSYTLQAERLGCDLIYCTKNGVNAFFIRADINPFSKKNIKRML